jgi:hypothetical protein
LWKALWRGRIQLTRRGKSARGHYVFATKPGEFGNSAGAFMRYGEVRGRNGVIIAEPDPTRRRRAHPSVESLWGLLRSVTASAVESGVNGPNDISRTVDGSADAELRSP